MSLRNKLIGTWKSHRKRTLANFVPYLKQKDTDKKRFISRLFGKLEVKYTRQYVHSRFKGSTYKTKYEIINETDDTLIIKVEDKYPEPFDIFNGMSYYVIQFDETRYHEYMSVYSSRHMYVEWFQKVKKSDTGLHLDAAVRCS